MILSLFKLLFARKHALLIAVCALVQFSCTNQPNRALSIDDKYSLAVEAVKHLDKKDIKNLVVLSQSDPLSGVIGDKVLLATFHDAPEFYKEGTDNILKIQVMWTATAKEVSSKMASDLSNCSKVRISQIIGVGPKDRLTDISIISVKVSDLFRPAYNPDVKVNRMSFNLESDNKKFISFFNKNFENNTYPWTALGYTYDYGKEEHYGLSEFVLLKGSSYYVEKTVKIDDYIKNRCQF